MSFVQELTVSRLGASSTLVAKLIAVAALHFGHVLRLGALSGGMALAFTVAADELLLLGAVFGTVTLLTAVVTGTIAAAATLRTITGEMAHYHQSSVKVQSEIAMDKPTLSAFSALNIVGVAWFLAWIASVHHHNQS